MPPWKKAWPHRRRCKIVQQKTFPCGAMQAVADFRGDFFQFFYAGDNLDHSQWQPRSLSGHVRLDDKSKIALLAFELAAKL